jgi:hypothetical protein
MLPGQGCCTPQGRVIGWVWSNGEMMTSRRKQKIFGETPALLHLCPWGIWHEVTWDQTSVLTNLPTIYSVGLFICIKQNKFIHIQNVSKLSQNFSVGLVLLFSNNRTFCFLFCWHFRASKVAMEYHLITIQVCHWVKYGTSAVLNPFHYEIPLFWKTRISDLGTETNLI